MALKQYSVEVTYVDGTKSVFLIQEHSKTKAELAAKDDLDPIWDSVADFKVKRQK